MSPHVLVLLLFEVVLLLVDGGPADWWDVPRRERNGNPSAHFARLRSEETFEFDHYPSSVTSPMRIAFRGLIDDLREVNLTRRKLQSPLLMRVANLRMISMGIEEGKRFPVDPKTNLCEGSTFCETPLKYPFAQIRNVYPEARIKYGEFFASDHNNPFSGNSYNKPPSYGSRSCRSKVKVIQPRAGRNKNGRWKYILENQFIKSEICESVNQPCTSFGTITPSANTSCEQGFAIQRLVTLNEMGIYFELDTFRIPSNCVCILKPRRQIGVP